MKTYLFPASFVIAAAAFVAVACSQSNFAGDGKAENNGKSGAQIPKGGVPGGSIGPGGPGGPGGSGGPTPTPSLPGPLSGSQGMVPLNEDLKCSAGKLQMIQATQTCGANSTAFAADDGSAAVFICCALPASDILLTSIPTSVRGGECMEDELVVGVSGNSVVCQKIDITKYKLGNPSKSCYFGNGAAGSKGSVCSVPNTMLGAIGNKLGNDGCITSPGNVVHGRNGRDCGDIPTRSLMKIDGSPVAFPY